MRTSYEANEQTIVSIEQILSEQLGNESYWQSRLENALETRRLYESTELKERPMLDYGTWLIVFPDDTEMLEWLEDEAEESEMALDDVLGSASVEYVLMTGVELGQLETFEM